MLARRGPHPSASQPPSPLGKALSTRYNSIKWKYLKKPSLLGKGRKKFVDRGKCGYYNKVKKVYRVLPEWAGSLKRGEGTTTGYGSDDETGRDCDDTAPKGMRELSGKRTGF